MRCWGGSLVNTLCIGKDGERGEQVHKEKCVEGLAHYNVLPSESLVCSRLQRLLLPWGSQHHRQQWNRRMHIVTPVQLVSLVSLVRQTRCHAGLACCCQHRCPPRRQWSCGHGVHQVPLL